jgi:hypothetical protein
LYREAARHEWSQARRKALWLQLRASLGSKKIDLINFDQLAERFDLGNASYQGVQNIPLAKIVGSLGRYNDFVQAFLPASESMSDRWQKVATLYLDPSSPGASPIEVYQVGDSYFVSDGNHRVSVARQLKLGHIEAHVWEYFKPVAGLAPGVDIDSLVIQAERRDFLEKTHLDELRPNHTIHLTAPGGYREMLNQIARYQQVLSWIDVTETPYDAAVTAWYDMIYKSTVLLIENTGVMKMFPNRTAADFFIWVRQHHQELEEQYGKPILLEEAVSDIKTQHHANFLLQSWRSCWSWLKQHFG